MRHIFIILMALVSISCATKTEKNNFIEENIEFATQQIGNEIEIIEAADKFMNPTTLRADGSIYYCGYADWRSGFFPGSVWYLYELTGDRKYAELGHKYSKAIEEAKNVTNHHDVGFMVYCSFGNGFRLTGNSEYPNIIVQAAKSLSTRFRSVAGVIQSWDVNKERSERGWECPVIIDNMMNLELMFEATKFSGDSTFHNIAIAHADRTLAEHFRPDGSCYHVIDYSLEDGSVRHRHTAQGYAHESVWSRGQAWAIYGYVVCYRETGEQKYLDQALKTFEFMRNHKNAADDLIPYWDMDAPDAPEDNPYFENRNKRDVSSASIIASALYEISTMPVDNPAQYKEYADRMMESLASPAYRAELGTNGNFLLMHSVGSIPHNSEIDVPLNYADYYFLEALKRKKDLEVD